MQTKQKKSTKESESLPYKHSKAPTEKDLRKYDVSVDEFDPRTNKSLLKFPYSAHGPDVG